MFKRKEPVLPGSAAGRGRARHARANSHLCCAILPCCLAVAAAQPCAAAVVSYELRIAESQVRIVDRPVRAVTINGSIPGPVLRFTEGDTARIVVRNELAEPTSIHWHGVLVPPGMDGVPWVSFPPIAPGASFTYEFPIRQSGTYWYHSHSGLQEQSGVYGAIVIASPGCGAAVDRDHVLLLSDWTDEDPEEVLRTLKRGGGWYALAKGSAQSLAGAARAGMLSDFLSNQLRRMPPMDIADVAYDRFLANGSPEIRIAAAGSELVRLRLINGSSTTYFHVEFAGGPLTIVAADGQDVDPVQVQRLLVAVAETYDLLVAVPPEGSWEVRATAHDASGYASAWLGEGEAHPAPAIPRPNVYRAMGGAGLREIFAITPAGVMGMPDEAVESGAFDAPGGMHGHHHVAPATEGRSGPAEHAGHGDARVSASGAPTDHAHASPASPPAGRPAMPPGDPRSGKRGARDFSPLGADAASAPRLAEEPSEERPWPPYELLRAPRPTAFPENRHVRAIRLTLDGDMERYVWFLDGRALWEDDTIPIRGGEVVRLILVNRTMMHHPMHLHGHFFRVVNGQGDRAPLKHTVDVAPMSTTVIELAADAPGDWLFHCHLLYHMESGMARVVRYEGFDPGPRLASAGGMPHADRWHAWADADLLTNMGRGELTLSSTRTVLTLDGETGWGGAPRKGWHGALTAARSLDAFFSLFAGAEASGGGGRPGTSRGIAGLRYLLPLTVAADLRIDAGGGARIGLEKELPLLPRLGARGAAAYDTREGWEGSVGLSWILGRRLSLLGAWDSDFGWGTGIRLSF